VNIICDNALLCAYARSQKTVSADIINEVARDLRLGSEAKVTHPETTPGVFGSKNEPETAIREATNKVPQHKVRRVVRGGVEAFLVILALIAVASLIDPRSFLTTAGRGLEVAKHNLNQWVLFISQQEAVPPEANAEVNFEHKEERVIVPRGSSVYKIATDTYGTNTALGIDLIKEFNPEIKNLSKVSAGRPLLLPALTPETLLRKQSDGSYHLIVASFQNPTGADEYAGRLRNKGYQVTITPRQVSDDLLLHRVQIDGLKNLEEVNQTWRTGLRNEWLAFAGNTEPGQ
jgi:hypothetical protein